MTGGDGTATAADTGSTTALAAPPAVAASAAPGSGRMRGGGDLEPRPFPEIRSGGPGERRTALRELRAWAEQSAENAVAWYLRDRRRKRTASRILQGLAIVFAVAGTAVPLGTAAAGGSAPGWGYVLLAVAAGCKSIDHFFGLSSGWMRDLATANALRAELAAVRLEFASDVLRAGPGGAAGAGGMAGPGAAGAGSGQDETLEAADVERQLALITRLVDAVSRHVASETAEWRAEFTASTRRLHDQGGLPGAGR